MSKNLDYVKCVMFRLITSNYSLIHTLIYTDSKAGCPEDKQIFSKLCFSNRSCSAINYYQE